MTTQSKTDKTNTQDPIAAVRKIVTDAVETLNASQEKSTAAATANLDATVAAGKIISDAAEQTGTLVQDHVAAITEDRMAGFKKVFEAKDLDAITKMQEELIKAEQAKVLAFAEVIGALTAATLSNAFKPIQEQVAANLELVNKYKAA